MVECTGSHTHTAIIEGEKAIREEDDRHQKILAWFREAAQISTESYGEEKHDNVRKDRVCVLLIE